ncbi:MAG: hypothetical protein AABX04_02325 [Nanoarchaeota archaeon]
MKYILDTHQEVSNRSSARESSAIELAVRVAAKLDYKTLSTLTNSKDYSEVSDLEREVSIDTTSSGLESQVDYALIPLLVNSSYDVSAEYGNFSKNPSFTTEYEGEYSSNSSSDIKTEMMTPLEYTEALMETQFAAISGAWSDVSYEQRMRMTNFFTYNTVLARAFHDMNCLTRDINFKVI